MWFSAGWFFPIPPLNSGAGQPFAVAAWCPRDFSSSNRIDSSDSRNWRLWRLWEVDNFSLISPRTPPTLARVSQADGEAKVHAQTLCSSQKVFCSLFFWHILAFLAVLALANGALIGFSRFSEIRCVLILDVSTSHCQSSPSKPNIIDLIEQWGQQNSMNLDEELMRHAEIVYFVYIGRLCLPWHFVGTLRRNQHQMSTLVQPRFRCCHPSRSVLPIGSPLTGPRVELETQSDSSCLITLSFDIKTIQGIHCWCCLHVSQFHTMFHYFWNIYFFWYECIWSYCSSCSRWSARFQLSGLGQARAGTAW